MNMLLTLYNIYRICHSYTTNLWIAVCEIINLWCRCNIQKIFELEINVNIIFFKRDILPGYCQDPHISF